MYCSQLVLKALENIKSYPFIILQETPMTFKDKNGEIPNIFIKLYQKVENIPEGKPGSHTAKIFLYLDGFNTKHDYTKNNAIYPKIFEILSLPILIKDHSTKLI